MKKMTVPGIAVVYAGCFLGAGYVSGQELWQFFGAYGKSGLWGLLPGLGLLVVFSLVILRLPALTGEVRGDTLVIRRNIPWLRQTVSFLEVLFLLGVAVIMAAGTGALLRQLAGCPHWLGCVLFCLVLFAVALAGLRGLVRVFSFSVPVLVAATVFFGIYALCTHELSAMTFPQPQSESPLLGGFLSGALIFGCYNVFGTLGILPPFGKAARGRTALLGVLLGTAFLLLVALSVLLSLWLSPEAVKAELPMLAVAEEIGTAALWLYGVLLLFSLFGAGLSSFVGMADFLQLKYAALERHRVLFLGVLTLATCLLSLFGFGDLVGVIYPVFGYSSIVFLVCLLVRYLAEIRKKRAQPD